MKHLGGKIVFSIETFLRKVSDYDKYSTRSFAGDALRLHSKEGRNSGIKTSSMGDSSTFVGACQIMPPSWMLVNIPPSKGKLVKRREKSTRVGEKRR